MPRSPSVLNLASLAYDTHRPFPSSRSRHSVSIASGDYSTGYGSENSQVLYMAKPRERSRKARSSLSSISNKATRITDGSSDTKADTDDWIDSKKLAWNVIDREIFEWQYVCCTGRPYWWSPESKYSRQKKLPGRLANEPPQSWMQKIDRSPKDLYSKERQPVSDIYIADQDCVEDLAQLVAIQLLSSCFTLPPDQNGLISPGFTPYNLRGPRNFPDPRLISSLRMHTHFRYSPSFGHQARNTSPVQLWSRSDNGSSPPSSPPNLAAGFQTPDVGTSGSPLRRRRAHRSSNITEGSANGCSLGHQSEEYLKVPSASNLDPTASISPWYYRQRIDDTTGHLVIRPYLSNQSYRRGQCKSARTSEDRNMPKSYRGVQSCSRSRSPTTNYRLQCIIRSEPHHVFVQPVKELVVKRWKTFRRHFGGSLHSPLPTNSTEFTSQYSSPVPSDVSSPAMSSDARARRRRAQERGDIHSSADNTPHYNSPASGFGTPIGNSLPDPFWIDSVSPSPNFHLTDPLAAAATLAMAEVEIPSASNSNPSESPNRGISLSAPKATSQSTPATRPELRATPSSSPPLRPKRLRKHQYRKSMLPEVHAPEGFAENITGGEADREPVDRSVLSAAGSALASSSEGLQRPASDINFVVIQAGARKSLENLGPVGAVPERRMNISSETNPSLILSKTSTSGTQIFTPGDDGVEVDGIPAGPSKEVWDARWNGKGNRREQTYL